MPKIWRAINAAPTLDEPRRPAPNSSQRTSQPQCEFGRPSSRAGRIVEKPRQTLCPRGGPVTAAIRARGLENAGRYPGVVKTEDPRDCRHRVRPSLQRRKGPAACWLRPVQKAGRQLNEFERFHASAEHDARPIPLANARPSCDRPSSLRLSVWPLRRTPHPTALMSCRPSSRPLACAPRSRAFARPSRPPPPREPDRRVFPTRSIRHRCMLVAIFRQ